MLRPMVVVACGIICVCWASGHSSEDRWKTLYEQSGERQTPRYEETLQYCRMLDSASAWISLTSFGRSPQGRLLPLVVVSRDRAFTPGEARKTGKAIVLIQAGIHAGEIDGKDACLMLLRDIARGQSLIRVLDHVVLLVVPIFNVDGHERFGPYHRINQNGPAEMGWRVTAQNLNLNRDYMKADAPEMRAMLGLFRSWLPDLLIDCHVTDGIDCQYDVTYSTELGPNCDPGVVDWMRGTFLPSVLPAVESSGHRIFWYVFPREENDLSKGLKGGAAPPRFSTGYAAVQNRPSLLIETHALKPYRTRVRATYAVLRAALETVSRSSDALRKTVAVADLRAAGMGTSGGVVPLRLGLGPGSVPRTFLGVRSRREKSEVSGGLKTVYTGESFETTLPFYDQVTVEDSSRVPAAYLIPREWEALVPVLQAHGIALETLANTVTVPVESYRFSQVRWRERPFEGRHAVTYRAEPVREQRTYPAGTIVVRTAQRAARVAVHLLEPGSEDSFVAWGFLSAIFEQKEYAEDYVIEAIAPRFLAGDSLVRKAYESKLQADSMFAADASARLNWLYQRSPWGDAMMNVYPIARVATEVALPTRELGRGGRGHVPRGASTVR